MDTSEGVSRENCCVLVRDEVANLLQPIIELHSIEVKDDRFEFPDGHPSAGVPESGLPDETKKTAILFEDITSISPFEVRVEVLLQCGELYIFSTTDSVRTHLNTYNDSGNIKSEKPVTAQDIAGNIWDGLDETLASGKDVQ